MLQKCFLSLDEKDVVNVTGLLLRCLASMVHHAEAIKRMMRRSPLHTFHSIVVFTELNLLEWLKFFVTMEPSEKLMMPSGVPPHTQTFKLLHKIVCMLRSDREKRDAWEENFKLSMKEAIQESASEAGHITKSKMLEILDSHSRTLQTNIKGHIEDIITTHLSRFSPRVEGVTDIQQTETEDTTARETYKSYCHSGKLGLHTCLGWDFPV